MSETSTPADKPSGPSGVVEQGGMAAALDRMRSRRASIGGSPAPDALPSETLEPGRPTPKGLLSVPSVKSDAGAGPDKHEDDDIFDAPEETQSGEPSGDEPAGSDHDDPVVWDDDGAPVKRSEAKSGYMRRKDYSAKTAEIAEQRKVFEQRIAETQQVREQYVKHLSTLQETQKSNMPAVPDPELRLSDPLLYQEKVAEYLLAQAQVRERDEEMQRVAREHFETAQRQAHERVAAEQAKMFETVPALKKIANDPVKLGKAFSAYRSGAKHYGYTDAELANLADHRAIRLLDDALRWRAYLRKQRGSGNGANKAAGSEEPDVTLKRTVGASGTAPRSATAGKQLEQALADHNKRGTMETALALRKAKRAVAEADARK